jgi:hypothetical protein
MAAIDLNGVRRRPGPRFVPMSLAGSLVDPERADAATEMGAASGLSRRFASIAETSADIRCCG